MVGLVPRGIDTGIPVWFNKDMQANPIPKQAMDSFRSVRVANFYAGDPGEPDSYSIQDLLNDGNVAEGYCADVSDLFVAHLAAIGIEAKTIDTTSDAMGYNNWRGPVVHSVVQVGRLLIDWTASQFVTTTDPVIKEA